MENAGHTQQVVTLIIAVLLLLVGVAYMMVTHSRASKRARDVLVILALWALLLMGIDAVTNKHEYIPLNSAAMGAGKPSILIQIGHLCCTGCTDDVEKALKTVTWLGPAARLTQKPSLAEAKATPGQAQAAGSTSDMSTSKHDYSGKYQAPVADGSLAGVDFVSLAETIRKTGLPARDIALNGVAHFQLVAHLPHMCCPVCVAALQDEFASKDLKGNPIWDPNTMQGLVAKPAIDLGAQTVTVEYHVTADVTALTRALEDAGFAPDTLKVVGMNAGD